MAPPDAVSVTADPSHIIVVVGTAILPVGVGYTMMLKLIGNPVQVTPAFAFVGVTVMIAVTGLLVGLIPMNGGMVPVPEAGSPMEVLLLVQL